MLVQRWNYGGRPHCWHWNVSTTTHSYRQILASSRANSAQMNETWIFHSCRLFEHPICVVSSKSTTDFTDAYDAISLYIEQLNASEPTHAVVASECNLGGYSVKTLNLFPVHSTRKFIEGIESLKKLQKNGNMHRTRRTRFYHEPVECTTRVHVDGGDHRPQPLQNDGPIGTVHR
jgi:hypothetical protein